MGVETTMKNIDKPYIERCADPHSRQLDLFMENQLDDDLGMMIKEYSLELEKIEKSRRFEKKSKFSVFQQIIPTFNMFAPNSFNRHIAKANIHNSAQAAIRADWLNVFEDLCIAYLREAKDLERKRAG
jgi:hypothetical protein